MSDTRIKSRVPFTDYVAMPALNISRLKELKRSPLHYQWYLRHPKESKALTLGTAAHTATLEPERFASQFAIWNRRVDSGNLAPRRGKEWDAFRETNAGLDIITEDEANVALNIASCIRRNPDVAPLLEAGEPEVTMSADLHGWKAKGRVDWWTTVDGEVILVGLKTARDCRPFQFGAQAARLGYHLQWAWYHDLFTAITGRVPKLKEIVVESEEPHACVVYRVPEDVIEQGRDEYMELLGTLADCEAKNVWPGPCPGEQNVTLPSWVYESADELGDLELSDE